MSTSAGSVAHARDNNFNLIRMLAASAVLFTHSYAMSTGNAQNEPLRPLLGMTPATMAVDVFFVTSGYLVSESLVRRGHLRHFIAARVLRIYPALWVSLALTLLACALWFTALPWGEFWSHSQTWRFIAKNATLMAPSGIELRLPQTLLGVPWSKPEGGSVNSSLWTLPLEVRMYLLLAAGFVVAHLATRGSERWRKVLRALVCVAALVSLPWNAWVIAFGKQDFTLHLFSMFFAGAALKALDLRRWLRFDAALAALALVVAAAFVGREAFVLVYIPLVPYITLAAAFAPSGPLLAYNRLGDYSYGVYIYACPVQQAIAWWWPGVSASQMTALALPIVLAFAVASWHGIEKRALALKPGTAPS